MFYSFADLYNWKRQLDYTSIYNNLSYPFIAKDLSNDVFSF